MGCSPWGREELGTTERLYFHFSLSCIGEGNGNPLQCSCLENPRDGGAWRTAIYGITQSRTRLKQLSSSSSSTFKSTVAQCHSWHTEAGMEGTSKKSYRLEEGEEVGDGRAEGLSAIGDGGQAAVSLMSDIDGTGSGSLLESDAHSHLLKFAA